MTKLHLSTVFVLSDVFLMKLSDIYYDLLCGVRFPGSLSEAFFYSVF